MLSHVSMGTIRELAESPTSSDLFSSSWAIKWADLEIGEQIAHGTTGKFYLAKWNSQKVVVEVLQNQELAEAEYTRLLRDQLIMR